MGATFPNYQQLLGDWAFVPFGVVLLGAAAFTYYSVPETRGKTLEQISADYAGG